MSGLTYEVELLTQLIVTSSDKAIALFLKNLVTTLWTGDGQTIGNLHIIMLIKHLFIMTIQYCLEFIQNLWRDSTCTKLTQNKLAALLCLVLTQKVHNNQLKSITLLHGKI